MKKKNSFGEITGLFRNVEFNKMNSKIFMASLSAISVLSSCGYDEDVKGSEDDKTQTQARTQYGQFHTDHRKLVNVLKEAFKNKEYAKAKGDNAVKAYINSLSKEQLENLSKYSPTELKAELESLKNKNEDDFELRFKEILSKPSNEKSNVQNGESKQSDFKEDEAKKKEEENKKLLGDVEKILNNLSKENDGVKEKFIGYFKFLSEIEEQSIEKSFIANYNKSTGNTEEEKVISCLKQTLNNVFKNNELLDKLSSKVVKHVQSSINDNDATKNKVNVKADSVTKDNNIETTISYSETSNPKNVINDNKQFYVIEEVEVTYSTTNRNEKVKIVVENSNEDDTLDKYELPDLNKLVIDKQEKLKEVINSYGEKLNNENRVDVSTFTGLGIKELFTKINDFYKKLIEGKDSEDKMILDNFDKTQWAKVFDKEKNFKKFIITELVGIIKKYYNDLPEETEQDKLDTCSKILFSGEVLNYYEDTSKNFVNLKNFYDSIDKTKTYDVSQYKINSKGESRADDDYTKGKYIPIYVSRSKNAKTDPTILDKEMRAITDNPSNASLFCLFNCELNKQYCEIFCGHISQGGIVISTTGESDGVNANTNKAFIAPVFENFRKVNSKQGNYVENKKYDGTNKTFREGMDNALDASFKSLQLVQDKGNAQNLKTLFFKYLDQITPQQMDSITDDSFVKWMNQNNIYLSIKSMNLDCIKMFCDTFFKKFFGGKKEVKTFMKAIERETLALAPGSYGTTEYKDNFNTAIGKIETSQQGYLDSIKDGEYTQYWYKLLENEILKKMS